MIVNSDVIVVEPLDTYQIKPMLEDYLQSYKI